MDNLARDAMLAKQAGMSYGRWKAMQEPVKPKKKDIPEGWKVCKGCGKAFKPHDCKQKYCDIGCREEAYKPRARELRTEYMRKYREKVGFRDG